MTPKERMAQTKRLKVVERLREFNHPTISLLDEPDTYQGFRSRMRWNCSVHGQFIKPYRQSLHCKKCSLEEGRNRSVEGYRRHMIEDRLPSMVEDLLSRGIGLVSSVDEYVNGDTILKWRCIKCNHRFECNLRKAQSAGCQRCKPKSKPEMEIGLLVEQLVAPLTVRFNDRTAIYPREIDIFVPEIGWGLEVNGSYWHSASFSHVMPFEEKRALAATKGIRLSAVNVDNWRDQQVRANILQEVRNLVKKEQHACCPRSSSASSLPSA